MLVLQASVILQYHCKLNTRFSFKPKWHLTHPSNKSKQFKHSGDEAGEAEWGGL